MARPRRGRLHRDHCLIAAAQTGAGKVAAVHQTWIAPARPCKKAVITAPDGSTAHDEGTAWPAKLVRGPKKGGAIRLTPLGDTGVIVMGERIETTASALPQMPGAAFWAGVELGNMAGRMARVDGTRLNGQPDLENTDAWMPPPSAASWC